MKKRSADMEASSSSSLPRAKKSLGQNFLADERVIRRIVDALAPRAGETIVEIGPGRGALTTHLIERAGRVLAVEFDRELVPVLEEKLGSHENFSLVQADALTVDFCALIKPAKSARVVANLPYYISTAILQKLIEERRCLTEMVLMLQREVVERITAPPATSERGYLSVLVEAYCEREALFDVAPGSFRPQPKVWSTVARLRLQERPKVEVGDERLLWRIVSAGFRQRRKTILNNLRHAPAGLRESIGRAGGESRVLAEASIEESRRAETLTLEEWAGLARAIEGS
ncbi:MAG TPA: 16S rRNA (adenine(1518)-N(6)/adenine(1519)-N(6))-dimethyltransferase RsmA [Pyrinomonadaceae bacterium]|nr:16S rRNA (adenine(1518)-N(6)/adenine(1519)-N(6))-dimethyltransferase RsmA [Pyrinomonadaceae bacterium]